MSSGGERPDTPPSPAPAWTFGPEWDATGARFRLFAPDAAEVMLELDGAGFLPMAHGPHGMFERFVPDVQPGTRYRFEVQGRAVPDPASRMQAEDADGWSVLTAPPTVPAPLVRPWTEAVIAEIHVGTATPEGTFRALIDRLDHYRDAGFTVLELMPVADFPGRRNWGYDGVLLYAPDRAYGTPDDLRALIDAAHGRGLSMMLDVVYNHFGPSGNYLPLYAKSFFRQDIATPWGAAINLDDARVRAFFSENAAYWLSEFGFDGLRLDAVHALATSSAGRLLEEIAQACRTVRPDAYLVLENHDNAAHWMEGDRGLFTAQWNDDWHHAFHVIATGEGTGYYAPYAADPVAAAGRALAEGFVFQGEPYPDASGPPRGAPSTHLPPDAFVVFAQNHDHIGNRPLGDRLAGTQPPERLALLRFVVMLSPAIPLLFQGEEALLPTPFPFFCDFEGDLADAVRKGRRGEFADFFAAHGTALFPDPLADQTFQSAKLTPAGFATEDARAHLRAFRDLAALRRSLVWPLTASPYRDSRLERAGDVLAVTWRFEAGDLVLVLNAGAHHASLARPEGCAGRAPDAALGAVADRADAHLALAPFSAALWSLEAGNLAAGSLAAA